MNTGLNKVSRMCFAIALTTLSAVAAANEVGAFSFAYTFSGDRSITPYQVFDDGDGATFLQYRDRAKVPSFFVKDKDGSGMRRVNAQEDGPYLRLDVVASRIELLGSDGKTAAIVSTKKPTAKPAPSAPRVAQAEPSTPAPAASAVVQEAPRYLTGAQAAAQAPVSTRARQQADELTEIRSQIALLTDLLSRVQARIDRLGADVAPASRSDGTLQKPAIPAAQPVQRPSAPLSTRATLTPASASPAQPPAFMKAVATQQGAARPMRAIQAGTEAEIEATPVSFVPQEAPTGVVFTINEGQRLSDAVRRFVANHNFKLDWDTGGADYQVRYAYTIKGATLEEALLTVLKPFKLSAVARRGNGVVAVTRAA